jgi:DNA-binding MarR family transcriptional regulator
MDDRQAAFVEEMGSYLSSVGMTPMAGRLMAWLLICDPEEQTAADLSVSLRASRGAISGAIHQLETAGFARRTRRRGDRREYISMPAGAIRSLVGSAATIYRGLATITAHGVGVVQDLPPPARERIQEFHDFVAFIQDTLPRLMADYLADREGAAQAQRASA